MLELRIQIVNMVDKGLLNQPDEITLFSCEHQLADYSDSPYTIREKAGEARSFLETYWAEQTKQDELDRIEENQPKDGYNRKMVKEWLVNINGQHQLSHKWECASHLVLQTLN